MMFALCLTVAVGDRLRAVSSVIDIDDTLRRLQIEDLLADNNWFDRTLPFVTPDAPYVSPWSRLVDAPYVGLTRLLDIFLPAETALDVACLVWPPMLLIPLTWLVQSTMRAMLGRPVRLIELACTFPFLIQAAAEFAPGRIDHHNVQMVLLALFVRGLTLKTPYRAGIVSGAAAVLSIAVGLETVPMLVAGLAGLAIFGALQGGEAGQRLQAAGAALALLSPLMGLVLNGPADTFSVYCDALSAPWVSAMSGAGLILLLTPVSWTHLRGNTPAMRAARLASLAVPGLVLLAGLAAAFPICTGGPLHMIDPATQAFWLDNVPQENSGLTLVKDPGRLAFALLICLAIGTSLLAGADAFARLKAGQDGAVLVWITVLAGVLMAVLAVRYARISFLLTTLILPMAICAVQSLRSGLPAERRWATRWAGAALAGSAGFLMLGFSPLVEAPHEVADSYLHFRHDACAGEDFAVLDQVSPGVVMAPFGMHYVIIEADAGHTLSTISFHRSAPGIRRLALAFTTEDPEVLREAVSGVDYIVVCARETGAPLNDMPLLRDLVRETPRAGFIPTAPNHPSRVTVYKIDPEAI
ncbi:MAG: hypothetical protein RLO80_04595 [Hyphomonas sp.]